MWSMQNRRTQVAYLKVRTFEPKSLVIIIYYFFPTHATFQVDGKGLKRLVSKEKTVVCLFCKFSKEQEQEQVQRDMNMRELREVERKKLREEGGYRDAHASLGAHRSKRLSELFWPHEQKDKVILKGGLRNNWNFYLME